MNSHIPNFFELVAYGDAPPSQADAAAAVTWDDIPYPQT
jgi:hypothetical protein